MKRNIISIAAVAAVLVAGAGTAFAAVDESTINTQTATLNFGATQQVQHTLTPVPNLSTELEYGNVLAKGSISTSGGELAELAYRYDPSFSGQLVDGEGNAKWLIATISGENDPANKLHVETVFDDVTNIGISASGWIYNEGAETVSNSYSVLAESKQSVPVDKYTISIQAGVWGQ